MLKRLLVSLHVGAAQLSYIVSDIVLALFANPVATAGLHGAIFRIGKVLCSPMNKGYCCLTENCTAANITAGYQHTLQRAQRPVPTLALTTDGLEADALMVLLLQLCGFLRRDFLSLFRGLMMSSTAVDNVLNCCCC